MMLFWRGWGFSVALLFVFWIWALILYAAFAAPYVPDPKQAMQDVEWIFAGGFALHALGVLLVIGYRRRKTEGVATSSGAAKPAPQDEFMFIRLVFWPYILFGVSALFAGAAYLGYPLFGR